MNAIRFSGSKLYISPVDFSSVYVNSEQLEISNLPGSLPTIETPQILGVHEFRSDGTFRHYENGPYHMEVQITQPPSSGTFRLVVFGADFQSASTFRVDVLGKFPAYDPGNDVLLVNSSGGGGGGGGGGTTPPDAVVLKYQATTNESGAGAPKHHYVELSKVQRNLTIFCKTQGNIEIDAQMTNVDASDPATIPDGDWYDFGYIRVGADENRVFNLDASSFGLGLYLRFIITINGAGSWTVSYVGR